MNPEVKSRAANPANSQNLQRDYTTESGLNAIFSVFRNSFDTDPVEETTLEKLAADIQGSRWQVQIERLRAMSAEEYSQNKRNLSAVTFGGIFTRRKKDALVKPSGLVVLDIDHIEGQELADTKKTLINDRHTALCFVSPSGAGLKTVFVADFSDDTSFKQSYRAISAYLMATYGLKIDESGKDVCRLCYVSYDPEAYYNPGAVQFVYEVAAKEPEAISRIRATPTSGKIERYVLSVINGELNRIVSAGRGSGNEALNIASMKVAQLYHLSLFDKGPIKEHFVNAYLSRGGSYKNKIEAANTFESGWNTGTKEPRSINRECQP